MADDLTERLDEFAERLLEDAERPPKKGEPPVTLRERLDAFKAVAAYLDKRASRPAPPSGKDDKLAERDDDEPTIVKLSRQVNRRRRA